jgi:hypothetical protein
MDNTGALPLRTPGFGDIPLQEELPMAHRFAHGIHEWKQVPAITRREFTMVAIMNQLTDKQNWHVDIFNQDAVDCWRNELLASTPLLSEKAWEWCVAELRDKAVFFNDKGYTRVLDTGTCVCKSDTLASQELCAQFQSGLESVQARHEQDKGGAFTYVDPSLYPLVWGSSVVLVDGGQVTHQGEVSSSTCTAPERAPAHRDKRVGSNRVQERMVARRREPWRYAFEEEAHKRIPEYFWSYKYQWLPSEVEFTKSRGTDVRFASYINNLHPTHTSQMSGTAYIAVN